jgi:hypothetical protein
MSKMIIEKNSAQRRFVSPSADSDLSAKATSSLPAMNWKAKAGLGLLVGSWALRRFPKTVLLGALAYGVYAGLNKSKQAGGKNPFQGEGIVKDLLH